MTDSPKWDDLTTAERVEHLRSKLATLRKAWPYLIDPPTSHASRRPAPGSRIPTNTDALSLRAEISRDLRFWVRSLLDDHPQAIADGERIDESDTLALVALLQRNVQWIAGWSFANRLAQELEDHAFDASCIAWPRGRGTILIGNCPNTIGADGEVVVCDHKVRATPGHEGDIKCRGCGKTDTLDGWLLVMVGQEKPVTIPQLRLILHRRLGLAVDERTLRRWHRADRIRSCGGSEGKPLFDRRQVMTDLMHEEEVTRRHALPTKTGA